MRIIIIIVALFQILYSGIEKELQAIRREMVTKEEFKLAIELMNKRFEDMNKRFEFLQALIIALIVILIGTTVYSIIRYNSLVKYNSLIMKKTGVEP